MLRDIDSSVDQDLLRSIKKLDPPLTKDNVPAVTTRAMVMNMPVTDNLRTFVARGGSRTDLPRELYVLSDSTSSHAVEVVRTDE